MKKTKNARKIEAKDLRSDKREKLHEVIPLSTPYVVYIDPTNLCNFKCEFCPTSDYSLLKEVGRKQTSIDLATFKKIIDDIKEFDQKLKLLSLYKDGEPLVNQEFPEMVKYAKEAKVSERIWTKTNGALLTPKLNTKLIEAGIDMIHISIESVSEEGYIKVSDAHIDYDEFRKNILDLYNKRNNCKIYIKIIDYQLTEEDKDKFYQDFQDRCDFISIEKLMGWSYSDIKDFTLGTKSDTYDGLPLIPKEVCAYPFYVMAVNADCSVSVCGNDWAYQTSIGDVREKSLKEIWNSEELFEMRKMFLEHRRRENKACANCYYLQIVPDNIDPFATQILQKLEEEQGKKNVK